MTTETFTSELVRMARAAEELPKVREELAESRNTINSYLDTIQRLETKLMARANELTKAQGRIRSLEVERDDAQFHALEADDRTQRALEFIKATFGNAGQVIQALEPPVPTPVEPTTPEVPVPAVSETAAEVKEPTANTDALGRELPQGQSVQGEFGSAQSGIPPVSSVSGSVGANALAEGAPIPGNGNADPGGVSVPSGEPVSTSGSIGIDSTSTASGASGVPTASSGSEPSPAPEVAAQPDPIGATATMTHGSSPGAVDTPATSSESVHSAPSTPANPSPPYSGKRYHDMPQYIPFSEWLEGGGTEYDYHWRPPVGNRQF